MKSPRALLIALVALAITARAFAVEFDQFFEAKEEALLREDLEFLYSIESASSSPLHQAVFGGPGGEAYRRYFEARIHRVRRSLTGANALAFTLPVPSRGFHDTIAVTSKLFEKPRLLRVSVLIHEARHSEVESDYWHHISCPNPYLDENGLEMRTMDGIHLAGQSAACDQSALGAYGVAVILLQNIARYCTNCSPEMKGSAVVLAQDLLKRIVGPDERERLVQDMVSP